jgi:drug/metabolite transporter (DMT)-like permease
VSTPIGAERRPLLPYAVLTVVTVIWASNTIISKLLLQEMSPALLTLVRFSLAAIFIYLPIVTAFRDSRHSLGHGEWKRLAVAGTLGSASSVLLFTIGIVTTPATYAGLMLMTAPLWTALMAWLFMGERLGRVRSLGMAISFLGAGALATNGQLVAPDAGILTGSVYLLLCQITWGGYTLLTKPLLSRRPPLLVLGASHLFALILLWPATAMLGAWAELPLVLTWSGLTWGAIAYLVVINSGVAQALYMYALRDVSAYEAMSFQYLSPVFTAIMAAAVLAEDITILSLVCGALILFGLWLVNRPRPIRTK